MFDTKKKFTDAMRYVLLTVASLEICTEIFYLQEHNIQQIFLLYQLRTSLFLVVKPGNGHWDLLFGTTVFVGTNLSSKSFFDTKKDFTHVNMRYVLMVVEPGNMH